MLKIIKNRFWVFSLFAICSAALGVFFRLYPVSGQSHREEKALARSVVYANLKNNLLKKIEADQPSLSESEKIDVVDQDFHKLLKENPEKVSSLIAEGVIQILGYDPQKAISFLFEGDSYFYYGLTENIQEIGSIGTQLTAGYFLNPLVRAPHGGWQTFSLHPYLGFYLYKTISFFNHSVSLMASIKWLVIVFTLLSLIFFVGICYVLKINLVPAFVGSIFFVVSPFFTQRTTYGWYDTDVYNVLFLGGILFLIFLGLLNLKNSKANVIYGISAALLTYLYKMFWVGWIYVPVIVLLSFCFILLLDWRINRFSNWQHICVFTVSYFFIAYFLSVIVTYKRISPNYLFAGWSTFSELLGAKPQLWPNMFLAVTETQPVTISKASFMLLGNNYLIYFAIFGSVIYLGRSIRNRDIGLAACSLVVVAFVFILFFVSLNSLRFVILLTFPLILSFTMFLEVAYVFLRRHLKDKFRWGGVGIGSLLSRALPLFMTALCIIPIGSTDKMCTEIHPVYNYAWEDVLRQIKAESSKDSIVNSWWPPGHFITAVARRSVLIDGSSLDSAQSYWISSLLLAEDEKTAIGILRMLDNGSDGIIYMLTYQCKMDFAEAIEFVKEIVALDKTQARKKLVLRKINPVLIEKMLKMLYAKPKPAFFLIYNGMIDEYLMLSYIASWDFKKAEGLFAQSLNSDKKSDLVKNSFSQRNFRNSVDYIVAMGDSLVSCSPEYNEISRENNMVRFENNIFVNLDTRESFLFYPDGKKFVRIQSLFFLEGDFLREFTIGDDASFPYSVFLFEKYGSYHCILFKRPFINTMLFKLYYLKGKGLSNFLPYIVDEDKLTKTAIMVYKINWDALN